MELHVKSFVPNMNSFDMEFPCQMLLGNNVRNLTWIPCQTHLIWKFHVKPETTKQDLTWNFNPKSYFSVWHGIFMSNTCVQSPLIPKPEQLENGKRQTSSTKQAHGRLQRMSSTKQAHGRLQRSTFSLKRPKQPKQHEQRNRPSRARNRSSPAPRPPQDRSVGELPPT